MKRFDFLLIAFSGGVDSTFLLAVARQVLKDRVLAVIAASPIHPKRETREAVDIAGELKVEHLVVQSDEMKLADFTANTRDRCYFCKKRILQQMLQIAEERGIAHIAHGANVDDEGDFRPGARAAEEMGIIAPLCEAGLTKYEIRMLSRKMGLRTWDKPAMACLASRIPYGTLITPRVLEMVDRAEEVMMQEGFRACRVRYHGKVARIEVDPEDFDAVTEQAVREKMVREFRSIGFSHIALDLEGYVQGSMNRDILD